MFVQPALAIGRLFWKKGDGATIDGLGPDKHRRPRPGHGGRADAASRAATSITMPFVMLVGVAALVTYFMLIGEVESDGELADPVRSSRSCRWWARCSAWS
mgnify:CR=1 FL=1